MPRLATIKKGQAKLNRRKRRHAEMVDTSGLPAPVYPPLPDPGSVPLLVAPCACTGLAFYDDELRQVSCLSCGRVKK